MGHGCLFHMTEVNSHGSRIKLTEGEVKMVTFEFYAYDKYAKAE